MPELEAIESDARDGLLRDDSHWLPLVIDLSRALRVELSQRITGQVSIDPSPWVLHLGQ